MIYQVKGNAVNGTLVMWRWGVRGRQAFYSPRCQYFSKAMPQDCELKKSQEINTDTLLPFNFQAVLKFHQMSPYYPSVWNSASNFLAFISLTFWILQGYFYRCLSMYLPDVFSCLNLDYTFRLFRNIIAVGGTQFCNCSITGNVSFDQLVIWCLPGFSIIN